MFTYLLTIRSTVFVLTKFWNWRCSYWITNGNSYKSKRCIAKTLAVGNPGITSAKVKALLLKNSFYKGERALLITEQDTSPNLQRKKHFAVFARLGYLLVGGSTIVRNISSDEGFKVNITGWHVFLMVFPKRLQFAKAKQNWQIVAYRLFDIHCGCRSRPSKVNT